MLNKNAIVVWRDSPVLGAVIFVREVLLVIGEEAVQLYALFEVLDSLHASEILKELKVAINVNASSDHSVPMDALKLDVSVVLLELKVQSKTEVNVWSLDGVHIFTRHLELSEIKVLGENLHLLFYIYLLNK